MDSSLDMLFVSLLLRPFYTKTAKAASSQRVCPREEKDIKHRRADQHGGVAVGQGISPVPSLCLVYRGRPTMEAAIQPDFPFQVTQTKLRRDTGS